MERLESGSILATLQALSPLALPFLENAQTVINFAKFLKQFYSTLLGHRGGQELARHTYTNLSAIVEPVAKDNAAQMNVSTVINGDVTIYPNLSSLEANAAQNGARKALALDQAAVTGAHQQVVLLLYQALAEPVPEKDKPGT